MLKVFHGEREYIEGLEKEIHAELRDLGAHHHFEWFEYCPEVAAIIERLEKEFAV